MFQSTDSRAARRRVGFAHMRLLYCRHHSWNFGDELNPWLWSRAMPFRFNLADSWLFVGIGTILNWPMMYGKVVVFGSGLGYGEVTDRWLRHARARWKFYCVRGPLTARVLQLDAATAVADPGLLVHRYFPVPPGDQ